MLYTQLIMTENRCYKANKKIKPKGIVVHSTGSNNPNLWRYVQPDDGKLGTNLYNNHWNQSKGSKCVHAFIGKLNDGTVAIYQTLPWDHRGWGVAEGDKGSYNNSHIQFEICEDNLKNEEYYKEAFEQAAQLCAYLCQQYSLPVSSIVDHSEAHALGYANNHGDVKHWLKKFDHTMDDFRLRVAELLGTEIEATVVIPPDETDPTLRKGAKGSAVKELQNLLLKAGYSLPKYGADGDYGAETLKAVKAFQKGAGLAVDGVCGRKTWAALRLAVDKPVHIIDIPGQLVTQANGAVKLSIPAEDIAGLIATLQKLV